MIKNNTISENTLVKTNQEKATNFNTGEEEIEYVRAFKYDNLTIEEIISHYNKCRDTRLSQIKACQDMKEVYASWPHYKQSYGYKLIYKEFDTFFEKLLPVLQEKIIDLESIKLFTQLDVQRNSLTEDGRNAGLLYLLPIILPPTTRSVVKVSNAVSFLIFCVLVKNSDGHGMMLDPPNRSSLWRFNNSFPINYNDNQNFCGGFGVQWYVHNGKCGACGDNYGDSVPRMNENTGIYGLGYIVAAYPAGSAVKVHVRLTANHKGSFSYSLCELNDITKPENDSCFKELSLQGGSEYYQVNPRDYDVFNVVQLPENFTCSHCVLRWHYRTGNSWGNCPNGEGAVGCGPQETFRSCSDIAIY
ncbi:hypothetical protein RN001_000662 [Aquatica leii]|uniref:Chitin-binding type-4 domain-containing protein n=1 Tax=Aquatica leii TaxID=1421715 RepID=A0AAN7PMK9_9COLE|nr:hypothetical protein RN001_000662 [Aquatica leii]